MENAWESYIHAAYYKRYLYELILSDRPCKPYLDIEWESTDINKENCTEFLHVISNDIIQIFNARYNLKVTQKNILVSQCHRNNKISFHIVINLLLNNQFIAYKTNRAREKDSAWDLYRALLETNETLYKGKIDESVYSLDREFRAIYSSKYGNLTPFLPIDQDITNTKFIDNCLDYFITHFPERNNIHYITTPEYIPISVKKHLASKKNINEYRGNHEIDYPDSNILTRFSELLQSIHPTAYFTGKTSDGRGWRYSYHDRDEACYTGHTHKHNGFSIYIKPQTGHVYMFCYSAKCSRLFKLGNLHIDKLWEKEAIHINDKYLQYHTEIKFNTLLKVEQNTLTGFINSFVNNGGNYAIKSRMGTGKTQLLKNIITTHFTDKKIIYLKEQSVIIRTSVWAKCSCE